MKRILITGANSYIGTSFAEYIAQWPGDYQVDTLDLVDGSWKDASFAGYDCVFHVAGIAHQKETEQTRELYYRVNRDLAVQVAQKARAEGIGQFVFMSSMSVYGTDVGIITPDTPPAPVSHYGKSKLEAEQLLQELKTEHFRIVVLRPPMVYGAGCKGNFQTMCALVRKSPVFPVVNNRRSMIAVDNLSAFVRLMIDRECDGLYFPQNRDYVNTTDLARQIAAGMGKKVWFSRLAGLGVQLLVPFLPIARKAFGSLVYEGCEEFDYCYCVRDLEESVRRSV